MGSCLPDELIARRVASGRHEEFEELLQRYRDRVYRICYRMAGNADDAEDWAQECFVRVYRQLKRYDASLPFQPWILRVVSNTCINLARARARRQEKVDLGLGEEDEGRSMEPGALQILISGEDSRRVCAAVESLPPALRQAVVLRVLEDLSFRELGETLGVPLQTAASRVRRALMMIRDRLERAEMERDR